jgi:murein L,D-transpeptidase YcbB/YkuD
MSIGWWNSATVAGLCVLMHGLAALPALAQSGTPVAAAPLAADAAPVPESGAPDPLTPQPADTAAPIAPGGEGAARDAAAAVETDPVIVRVREWLAALPPRQGAGDKDDLAAAVTYYGERQTPLWTDKAGLTERGKAASSEIAKADDWGLDARAFALPAAPASPPSPEALAEAEGKLALAVLAYARHARGGRFDPPSISRKFDQKPAVFEPRSVLQGIASATAADEYLRGLHPRHPQFERLRRALLAQRANAASATPAAAPEKQAVSVRQLLVNMERWRWMPPELGQFYVWNSIPEQMTSVVENGKVVLSEKIVVGKTSSPTPVFSADMQFVIFHPSWGVPAGIKSHELGPKLRNSGGSWFSFKPPASSVLRAHGLVASRGGKPVDPDSIDWEQANINSFHFTQPAGARNVLGIVKFRFPNKHDVYMHDTTERHLFGGAVRAFSHGCMRVQNPMHLAEVLLAHDKGWSKDEVKAAERRGEQVTLTTPIPVHNTYFTVTVDDAGGIATRADLYGLDSRVASALEGREVSVASAPAPRAERPAGASARPRVGDATRRKQRARQAASSEASSSPFSGLFGN